MSRNLLSKARRLRQSDATWLCSARRAHCWVAPKGCPPYRPYAVLVMDQEKELVRRIEIQEERPPPDTVLEILVKAMLRPMIGSGRRARPARVLLDDAGLVQALAPRLAEIDVHCSYRPSSLVANVLREMGTHVTKREPIPGLLSVPGVTEPLVRELFTAAADYYHRSPWRWMNNSWPIEVRYPPEGQARYAVVLGSGGEFFGLSLYESPTDLRLMYSGAEPGQVPSFSVVFEEAMGMSFDDLDAMEKYGWPVAGERAYPLAIKIVSPDGFGVPSGPEIAWLAATMRIIPDFVVRHLHADHGLPRPAEVMYSLPDVHGGQKIALRYPVSLLEPEEQELEEYIEDWYWDGQSHEFARQVGAFLFQFMDYLETTGLSERTIRKHESNCWSIGKLTCDYGYYDEFSPAIFLGEPAYLIEFERKVSDSKYAVASYKATWRKLARYVRSLGYADPA